MRSSLGDPPTSMSDSRFARKTIIITGAGGNFGRSGCLFFLRRGANIAAMDVDTNTLNETIAELEKAVQEDVATLGVVQLKGYTCDITNPKSVDSTVSSIVNDFGHVDMLWNNAGYQGQIKPTLDYDPVDFARVMNVNVTGMFIVLQSVAKQMTKQMTRDKQSTHPYSIVNTASVAGLRGTPAMVAYSSSKAAVLAMTVSSSKVLFKYGYEICIVLFTKPSLRSI